MPVDARSIGELLLDADLIARRLLLDVTGQDGPPMLATFDEVVRSACRLWGALPSSPGGDPSAASMRQLAALSESMHRSQTTRDWPPSPTTRDARLGTIVDTFDHATRLARSRQGRAIGSTVAGQADLAAARARIIHTLYVGSHAVGIAVRAHVRDVELLPQKRASTRMTRGIPRGLEAAGRLATFERMAGDVIGNRFGDTVARQYQPRGPGEERLRFALIDWDIRAHKVLGETPTLASVHLIAQTQAGIATGASVILHAAHESDLLDSDTYSGRVQPAVASTEVAWSDLSNEVGPLLQRAQSPRPDLIAAAAEVRAALFEVAYDKSTWASAAVIASRVDLREATNVVSHALAASADIAGVTQLAIVEGSDLQVTTQGVAAYAATSPAIGRSDIGLELSAQDLRENPSMRIPDVIREALTQRADRATRTSGLAAAATGKIMREGLPQELIGARTALKIAENRVIEARQDVIDARHHVGELLKKLQLPQLPSDTGPEPAHGIADSAQEVREQLARLRATRATTARPSTAPLDKSSTPTQRREPRPPHL